MENIDGGEVDWLVWRDEEGNAIDYPVTSRAEDFHYLVCTLNPEQSEQLNRIERKLDEILGKLSDG